MDDFYAARSGTIPPLPWTNFAPPLSKGIVKFYTEYSVHDDPLCPGILEQEVSVFVPTSDHPNWTVKPNNNSKFVFKTDEVVRKMSLLRLDFSDIDTFEGVWGLSPWPDRILDKNGGTDTFDLDVATGSIKSKVNNNNIYAFYYDIPEEIEHWYHGSWSCHAGQFTGFTLERGPSCELLLPELLTSGLRQLGAGEVLELPEEGYDLISARVRTLRGAANVSVGGKQAWVPVGEEVSWTSEDPNAIISPVTIRMNANGDHVANATWVSKRKLNLGSCDSRLDDECPPEMIVEEFCDLDEETSAQVPFVRTTTLDCRGIVISIEDKTPDGQAYTVKNDIRKCVCEETEVVEQLCDVTRETTAVPLVFMQVPWTSPSGVTMTSDSEGWVFYVYNVMTVNETREIHFSEEVDVDFGLAVRNFYSISCVVSEGVEPYWLDDNVLTWDPATRTITSNPMSAGLPPANPSTPWTTHIKFRGSNVSHLSFTTSNGASDQSLEGGLTFLELTSDKAMQFTRTTTLDCDGAVVSTANTTADGELYEVKGTVEPC